MLAYFVFQLNDTLVNFTIFEINYLRIIPRFQKFIGMIDLSENNDSFSSIEVEFLHYVH